jgi:hypothetical protein
MLTIKKRYPRFSLETLQTVRYCKGDGETTIAEYTYTHNGETVKRYSPFEDLTHAEREAALCFILMYGTGQTATRKAKPRGRAVAQRQPGYKPKPRKEPPPFDLSKLEIEPITLEQLETAPDEMDHSGEN